MVPESEFAADGDCYHRGTLDSSVTVSISHGRISILTRQCGCLFVDFHSYVTCIVVSYIGLMLVDMGKVQYCHGHTRQCTTPSRRFSSFFCTTDVKCIARSYVCRIYTGHILLSSIGRTRIETTSTRMQQNSYVNTECHYMMYFS